MSFYVSTGTFVLLHCDEWDRVVALPRHKFVTGATLLQLAERQLSDDRFCNKSDKDPTKQFSDEITNELNNIYDYGYIDEKTLKYLIPDSPKPGRFYLLPKIHKANNPGRSIVSANGHPTDKISEFVDFHLRQHSQVGFLKKSSFKESSGILLVFSPTYLFTLFQGR